MHLTNVSEKKCMSFSAQTVITTSLFGVRSISSSLLQFTSPKINNAYNVSRVRRWFQHLFYVYLHCSYCRLFKDKLNP